jgi:hypothetical protein
LKLRACSSSSKKDCDFAIVFAICLKWINFIHTLCKNSLFCILIFCEKIIPHNVSQSIKYELKKKPIYETPDKVEIVVFIADSGHDYYTGYLDEHICPNS